METKNAKRELTAEELELIVGGSRNNPLISSAEKEDALKDMLNDLNTMTSRLGCNLEFSYDSSGNINMKNKSTGEIVSKYPAEEMVENMAKAKEWIGAFLDKMT